MIFLQIFQSHLYNSRSVDFDILVKPIFELINVKLGIEFNWFYFIPVSLIHYLVYQGFAFALLAYDVTLLGNESDSKVVTKDNFWKREAEILSKTIFELKRTYFGDIVFVTHRSYARIVDLLLFVGITGKDDFFFDFFVHFVYYK